MPLVLNEEIMGNRFCVSFKGEGWVAVNNGEPFSFTTGTPKRIGDDAIIRLGYTPEKGGEQRKVRFLKSSGMVKDTTYLVDLENRECWEWTC